MNQVIICGDCGDRELTAAVVRACCRYGGAFVCDGTSVYETGKAPEFCIVSVNSLSEVSCGGVLIFGQALCQLRPHLPIGNVIPMADSGNSEALSLLCSIGKPVIGCSMSGSDTLSLSCRRDGEGLVCLQRCLRTVSGRLLEPCEFSFSAPPAIPIFPLLAACGVLLLFDIPFEQGYHF